MTSLAISFARKIKRADEQIKSLQAQVASMRKALEEIIKSCSSEEEWWRTPRQSHISKIAEVALPKSPHIHEEKEKIE